MNMKSYRLDDYVIYHNALKCIAQWPDNYEEVAFPEIVAFTKVVLNAPTEIITAVITLAEYAISHDIEISPELTKILKKWGGLE